MPEKIIQIEKKIANIKKALVDIGQMRPGSLTKQYQKPKEKKGGFYQLSYTHHMKSRTEYVRPEFVKELRNQITEYKRFRKLVQTWTELSIEHSRLKIELAKQKK